MELKANNNNVHDKTDQIALKVLQKLTLSAGGEIKQQLKDNIDWIKAAKKNKLVVGSKARILYANSDGRILIAKAFNKAVKKGQLQTAAQILDSLGKVVGESVETVNIQAPELAIRIEPKS